MRAKPPQYSCGSGGLDNPLGSRALYLFQGNKGNAGAQPEQLAGVDRKKAIWIGRRNRATAAEQSIPSKTNRRRARLGGPRGLP
ncbi:MAG: hypothetical protein WA231_24315, partial [Methylocella sp.]